MKVQAALSRALAALIFLGFAAGTLVMLFVSPPEGGDGPSVTSAEAGGRRALFLVLQELGLEPRGWQQAPVALPAGEHVLWLSRPPFTTAPLDLPDVQDEPEADEREARRVPLRHESEGDPSLADPRHPWNYGEFVRGGGTLVAVADAPMLAWLRDEADLAVPEWPGLALGASVDELLLDTGETLRVVVRPSAAQESGELEGWHEVATAIDEEGLADLPFAAWCELGAGRVMLLADDRFLGNDSLGEQQNALLAVRLVEAVDRGGELLFDEYALGRWQPPTSVGLLAAPGLREVTWHVIFFALCVLAFSSWSREFPRDPDPQFMNPRMRAKAGARLYERARRYDLLARELQLGVLRRLAVRWKLARSASGLHADSTPEELAAVAREVARRAGRSSEQAAADARLFASTTTEGHGDFVALSTRLRALEAELEPEHKKPRRSPLER